jgi:chitin disaccharide deacetylase
MNVPVDRRPGGQSSLSAAGASVRSKTGCSDERSRLDGESPDRSRDVSHSGLLIVNADDWGRDPRTTSMILDCVLKGAVSSVSAMVFMEDSERAAAMARERGIDSGLHLNFTTPFSAPGCPVRLVERHQELARYLLRHRLAPVVFHPGLVRSFEYVVAAQLDEFRRLYGASPDRLDGHHHMHLCANVLFRGVLPRGTVVRRNFSFQSGEKGLGNRLYRGFVDRWLQRRHRIVDFFFSLAPIEPSSRLERVFCLAHQYTIELETHPVNPEEYRFLAGGQIFRRLDGVQIAPPFVQPWHLGLRPKPTQSGRFIQ